MLFKNAVQKIHIYAYNSTTGAAVANDQAQITGYVSLDGTANAIDDTNPAQVDATNMPGIYAFDLTAAETNCDSFALYAKSSTANVRIEPIIGFTTAGAVPAAVAGAAGGMFIAGTNAATSITTALTANITGNITGAVSGAVGSVTGAVGSVAANGITATSIAADAINATGVKADAVTKIQAGLATPTNITAGVITTVTNLTNAVTLAADQAVNVTKINGTAQTAKDLGALNVTAINTLAGHDPGATLVKVADLGTVQTGDSYAIVNSATIGNAHIDGEVDTLVTRLTATRAGYLDQLEHIHDDTAGVNTKVDTLGTNLAKVPKSDGSVSFNSTALAAINAEVDAALNTAIPGSPTADSINERIVAIDGYGAPPSAATIKTTIEAAGSSLALILEDTGTTLPGTLSTISGYLDTEVAAILADTNELQTDWANGGRLDLILDAASAPTAAAVADAVWDEALSGHATGGSAGAALTGATAPSAATVADAVWDEALSGHTGAGTSGLALATASSGGVDPSVLADAIWDEALSGHSTGGTAGKKLTDLVNADLSDLHTDVGTAIADIAAVHVHVGTIDGHITADYGTTEKAAIDLLDDAAGGLADIHTDVGTVLTNLATVDGIVDDIHGTDLPAVKGDTAAILADTGTDGVVVVAASKTGYALTSAYDLAKTASQLDAAGVRTAVGMASANLDTQIAGLPTDADVNAACDTAITDAALATATNLGTVDGIVDAIKLKTDLIPASPAAVGSQMDLVAAPNATAITAIQSGLATATNLATVDTVADGIATNVINIQSRLPAALVSGRVSADVGSIAASVEAATDLAAIAASAVRGTVDTAAFSATVTAFESDITAAVADSYNGNYLKFTSGALSGIATEITDYALAGGKGHFTVVALPLAPSHSDAFFIF